MEGEFVVRRDVKITTEDGLHLRPITLLVRSASRFSSAVSLSFDGRKADVKSTLDLMTLGAPCGAILALQVSGHDPEDVNAAADSICGLFRDGFPAPGPVQ